MGGKSNRSVERAFKLVDELAENGGGGVSELAERLDMPVSTVHDYLQALVATGYVTMDDKEYQTTTRFLEVGHRQRHRLEVFKAVRDELEDVAVETGEHATLLIEEADQAVILAVQEGPDAVNLLRILVLGCHCTRPRQERRCSHTCPTSESMRSSTDTVSLR